jgi:hypothetical protein
MKMIERPRYRIISPIPESDYERNSDNPAGIKRTAISLHLCPQAQCLVSFLGAARRAWCDECSLIVLIIYESSIQTINRCIPLGDVHYEHIPMQR